MAEAPHPQRVLGVAVGHQRHAGRPSTGRVTCAWPIRSRIPRPNISIIGIGSTSPPWTPLTETVPPRRTAFTAACSASSRSTAATSVTFLARLPAGRPRPSARFPPPADAGAAVAVGLHPHGVDDRGRAPAAGHADQGGSHVPGLFRIHGLDPEQRRCGAPLWYAVDADNSPGPEVLADPGRQLAHRAQAQHRQRPAVRDIGVDNSLVRGGQHIGQAQNLDSSSPSDLTARLGLSNSRTRPGHRHPGRTGRVAQQRRPCPDQDLRCVSHCMRPRLAHPAVPQNE